MAGASVVACGRALVNLEARAMSTANQPTGAEEGPSSRNGLRRFLRLPVFLTSAAVLALVGFLVNYFAPDAVEKLEDPQELRIDAEYDAARYADGWTIATAREPDIRSAPPPGSDCEDAQRWALRTGGAFVGETWLRLLLEGRRSGGIVIDSIRARILDRGQPYAGSTISCPSAGEQGTVKVGFDLDSSDPVARSIDAEGNFGRPYFSDHSITLAKDEIVTLGLTAKATSGSHRWVIDVRASIDGKEKRWTIGGSGCRTTSAASSYLTRWDWRWDLTPPRLLPKTSSTGQVGASDTGSQGAQRPPAGTSSGCANGRISGRDRDALSVAARTSEPAVSGSVYYGTCDRGAWALARFPSKSGTQVFRRTGTNWASRGTLDEARCGIPLSLLRSWKVTPC